MPGDNKQAVVSKKNALWAWQDKISAGILRINTPLENHYSAYYVTSSCLRDTRGVNSVCVLVCVSVCWSWGSSGV